MEGHCPIEKGVVSLPPWLLGISAKFGSLQGGHRVQCSSDSNDDIILKTITSEQGADLTSLAYIPSEENHDELGYVFWVFGFLSSSLSQNFSLKMQQKIAYCKKRVSQKKAP